MTDTPSSPPTGRWGRAARLLTLAGTGRALARDPVAATEKLAEVLGSLRGIAAKGAQLASYVDGVVPPEHEALFEATLGRLRAQAPRTSPDQARGLVEAELGAPLSALFLDFEAEARASGSLGQVHRATLHDGRAVAVKVQHAGMAEAVEADLANMSTLEALVGPLGGRRHGTAQVVALLSARFREELDYRREATHLADFAALHAGDPTIRVPAVIPERSAGRVLTTEWVEGLTLAEAAQQPDEVRRVYAETLWRFVFVSNFVGRRFNADPHPGNYVFQPGGAVYFLDFGCVQTIPESLYAAMLALHMAALEQDERVLRRAATLLFRTRGGAAEARVVAHAREVLAPLYHSPYRVERAYAARLFVELQGLTRDLVAAEGGPQVAPPPETVLMTRQQTGFYSVLARLDVAADYAGVSRAALPRVQV